MIYGLTPFTFPRTFCEFCDWPQNCFEWVIKSFRKFYLRLFLKSSDDDVMTDAGTDQNMSKACSCSGESWENWKDSIKNAGIKYVLLTESSWDCVFPKLSLVAKTKLNVTNYCCVSQVKQFLPGHLLLWAWWQICTSWASCSDKVARPDILISDQSVLCQYM